MFIRCRPALEYTNKNVLHSYRVGYLVQDHDGKSYGRHFTIGLDFNVSKFKPVREDLACANLYTRIKYPTGEFGNICVGKTYISLIGLNRTRHGIIFTGSEQNPNSRFYLEKATKWGKMKGAE